MYCSFSVIIGSKNDDIITGTALDDIILGKKGNDTIYAGDGNDWILAGKGNDIIFGEGGHDVIRGGAGNDIINGGSGSDIILAEEGNDKVIYNVSENQGVGDYADGGSGYDTLVVEVTFAQFTEISHTSIQADFNATSCSRLFDFGKYNLSFDFDLYVKNFEKLVFDVTTTPNLAPHATSDLISLSGGMTSVGSNVLLNDTDPEMSALSVVKVNGSTANIGTAVEGVYGTLTLLQNGSYTYTLHSQDPLVKGLNGGEIAIDSFTYTISDTGGLQDTATLNVSIVGVNDAPQAVADAAVTSQDTPITIDVLANDTDVDTNDNPSNFRLLSANVGAGMGSVNISGGQIQFDPGHNFDYLGAGESATVLIDYTMADQAGAASSSTVTVTINGVNDAPHAVADAATTSQNTPITVDVLANDTDVDAHDNPSNFTLVSASVGASMQTVNISGGHIEFDPGHNFDYLGAGESTTVHIDYTMADQFGAASSSTLELTINGVNDAPIAKDDNITVHPGIQQTINLFADNGYGVDFDPDNGSNLFISQINGQDIIPGNTFALSSGANLIYAGGGDIIYTAAPEFAPTFTGDASHDFQGFSNTIVINDGLDVPLPSGFPAPSGWDIDNVNMLYNSAGNDLYVGINTFGIFGDADGNGDPSTTGFQGSDTIYGQGGTDTISGVTGNDVRGGQDLPNLSGSEQFIFLIDTTDDNIFNPTFVAGVDSSRDISSFGLYEVASYTGDAGNVTFGNQIANGLTLFANPDAAHPDLEFVLNNVNTTMGLTNGSSFSVQVYAGSSADASIGEDRVGNNGPVPVHLQAAPVSSFSYTVSDSSLATAHADVHVAVVA